MSGNKFCIMCGAQLGVDDMFCTSCGARQEDENDIDNGEASITSTSMPMDVDTVATSPIDESANENILETISVGRQYLAGGDFSSAEDSFRSALSMGDPAAKNWLAVTYLYQAINVLTEDTPTIGTNIASPLSGNGTGGVTSLSGRQIASALRSVNRIVNNKRRRAIAGTGDESNTVEYEEYEEIEEMEEAEEGDAVEEVDEIDEVDAENLEETSVDESDYYGEEETEEDAEDWEEETYDDEDSDSDFDFGDFFGDDDD